jgi:hypothetical protein
VLQVSTPLFEQVVVPSAHTPRHAPLTQVEFVQGVGDPQLPAELQVSTPLPEHWVVAGLHVPLH